MSLAHSNFSEISDCVLFGCGLALISFPSNSPWYIALYLCAVIMAGIKLSENTPWKRVSSFALVGAVFFAGVAGFVPMSLLAGILSITVLAAYGNQQWRYSITLGFLLFSGTLSAEMWLTDIIETPWVPLLTPSAITLIAVFLFVSSNAWRLVIGIAVITISLWAMQLADSDPVRTMIVISLVSSFYAAMFMTRASAWQLTRGGIATGVVALVIVMSTWIQDMPRQPTTIQYFIPNAEDAYEAKFFDNYTESLSFVGISAEQIFKVEDLRPGALVLMPWLTEEPMDEENWLAFVKNARDKQCILVLFGEHTNLGKVADRINELSIGISLRNDLTIPPGNTDEAGTLRSPGIITFNPKSLLNRGASVHLGNPWAKVILIGEGWHTDPPAEDFTWVGNYVVESEDRQGQIALAASVNEGARWILVGDNSFILNRNVIADPRALLNLLALASLWPIFFNDLILLFVCGTAIALGGRYISSKWAIPYVWCLSILLFVLSSLFAESPSQAWNDFYVHQGGFDSRNFNLAMVDLLGNENMEPFHIVRHNKFIDVNRVAQTTGKTEIHFGQVENGFAVGPVLFNDCWGLGSLAINNPSITLQDAQACKVEGASRILIGGRTAASAVEFSLKGKRIIIILDKAFLSNAAGRAVNRGWIEELLMPTS